MSTTDSTGRPTAFDRPGRVRKGVDFGLMYAAHDAFLRDLDRLLEAVVDGRAAQPGVRLGWETFMRQLHVHHTAEDASLWPALRERVVTLGERAVLGAMEREHAMLDPLLERVDAAMRRGDGDGLAEPAAELTATLAAHMRHEENRALPLVAEYLGNAGWAEFGRVLRREHGVRGGAEFIPWLLDGARGPERGRLLALLPPPVRILYRTVFRRRYARGRRWLGAAA